MQDSLFTKIIKGELPSHKVYEDEKTLAFLTISPFIEGHTLVVPKLQVDNFEDLPEEDYQAFFSTVRKVSKRVKEVFEVNKATVTIMGFEVPHAHAHIMPANSENEYFSAIDNRHLIPAESDHEKLAKIAERLKF